MNLQQLPAIIKRRIPTVPFPLNYERAKTALAECVRVDQAKEYKDKAEAIACYAKQIKDDSLLRMARSIELRALRRIGELLEEYCPQKAAAVKDATGVSPQAQKKAIQIAKIPKDTFESILSSDSIPGSNEVVTKYNPLPKTIARFARRDPEWEANLERLERENRRRNAFDSLLSFTRMYGAVALAKRIPADERSWYRETVESLTEWLDEFEQNLPMDRST